jgi:predicted nuclease of predicted toxin-antitoxin system
MKLLFDEILSPVLVELLRDLFPDSESALRNGLAGVGDRRILEYASARSFVMVSTDSDFEGLLGRVSGANVVILRSCKLSNTGSSRGASAQCHPYRSTAQFPQSLDHSRPVAPYGDTSQRRNVPKCSVSPHSRK